MAKNLKSITDGVLRNFVFTKDFEFRTVVPVEVAANRISEIPFTDGNSNYTTEIEPAVNGYLFDIWEGNKYQREPEKARILGTGTITRLGNETLVRGEVRVGLNRMLMWTIITVLMGMWMWGLFYIPYGFIYLFYTVGFPIFAPLFLLWQSIRKRNAMLEEIQTAITPRIADRRQRLSDQQQAQRQSQTRPDQQQRRSR